MAGCVKNCTWAWKPVQRKLKARCVPDMGWSRFGMGVIPLAAEIFYWL